MDFNVSLYKVKSLVGRSSNARLAKLDETFPPHYQGASLLCLTITSGSSGTIILDLKIVSVKLLMSAGLHAENETSALSNMQ